MHTRYISIIVVALELPYNTIAYAISIYYVTYIKALYILTLG